MMQYTTGHASARRARAALPSQSAAHKDNTIDHRGRDPLGNSDSREDNSQFLPVNPICVKHNIMTTEKETSHTIYNPRCPFSCS